MINRIITFSVRHKMAVFTMLILWIGVGLYSLKNTPIDAVPDITNNQIQIITSSPNLSTSEIEQFVTSPVELAMGNLPGVKEIRSISRFGLSVVTLVFNENDGTYLPRQLASEKLLDIREQIPKEFGTPELGPITTGLGEIYQYTLEVNKEFQSEYSLTELRSIQDWIVKRQMSMLEGVVEVNSFGGYIKQYEIALDQKRLNALKISVSEVQKALENNNANTGAAYIERDHQAQFIRGEGLATSIHELESIVIRKRKNIAVHIKDIADVRIGSATRYGAFTKDGKEAVGGMVLMLKDQNSAEVIEKVKSRIAEIQKNLPEGITIVPFHDRASLVERTISTVRNNLLEGGLVVIFVLVLLLGNYRGGLIVASTIPLSLLFAFICMYFSGVWANLMSLGAIDFGIIVDGAVIIVEAAVASITAYLAKNKSINTAKRQEINIKSASKMMKSAFFGQLIILLVFIPILTLEGVEGKMFIPMALTFVFAIAGAMILCLTYVPAVSDAFIRVKKTNKATFGEGVFEFIHKTYKPILNLALEHKILFLSLSLILFIASLFTFNQLGGEFIPQLDEGDIAIQASFRPGTALTDVIEGTQQIERILNSHFPEVESAMARIGVSEIPTDPMPMDIADMYIKIKPQKEWPKPKRSKADLIQEMEHTLEDIPGINFEFTQPVQLRFNELLTGVRQDIAIKIYGENPDVLSQIAQEAAVIIRPIDGVGDLSLEATKGLPQINVKYKRNLVSHYGIDISELNQLLQTATGGIKAGKMFEGERYFDLVIRYEDAKEITPTKLQNLRLNLEDGSTIALREVADIDLYPGPMQISREETRRRTYIGINSRGRDVESLVTEIQNKLDTNLELPSGYTIRYGGSFENLKQAKNRLLIVVPLVMLTIFGLLYIALKSVKQMLMISLSIPLGAIGGIFALALRGMPFSISAGIGFIVLFGVVVLNGLVLINSFNELEEDDTLSLRERIFIGTKSRLRPIFLTASTDILGFLPMAISTTAGAEVQRPLATVVIGGLLTASLLTLLILPLLYEWIYSDKKENKHLDRSSIAVGLLILICFLGSTKNAIAQNKPQDFATSALQHHPLIKLQNIALEKNKSQSTNSLDIGQTFINYGGEEIANGEGLYSYGINQNGIKIFQYAAKKTKNSQLLITTKAQQQWEKQQLVSQIKSLIHQYVYEYNCFKQYELSSQSLETIKQSLSDSTTSSYYSDLELLLLNQEIFKVQNQLTDSKILLERLAKQIEDYTQIKAATVDLSYFEDVEIIEQYLLNHSLTDTNSVFQNSLEAKSELAKADFLFEKSKLAPNLNLSYAIQNRGSTQFNSFQVGIRLPLNIGVQKSKLKNKRLSIAEIEANNHYQRMQFEQKKKDAWHKLTHRLKLLNDWNQNLKNLPLIHREMANEALLNGNFDIGTYLKSIQEINSSIQLYYKVLLDIHLSFENLLLFTTNQDI